MCGKEILNDCGEFRIYYMLVSHIPFREELRTGAAFPTAFVLGLSFMRQGDSGRKFLGKTGKNNFEKNMSCKKHILTKQWVFFSKNTPG